MNHPFVCFYFCMDAELKTNKKCIISVSPPASRDRGDGADKISED